MNNINNFDKTRHRIVLQIDNKTNMLTNNTLKIFLPRKAPTIPILPCLQPTANVWAKAYVYDFKADEIVLARKQEFAYNPILHSYFATDTLLSTTNMILGDFTRDKKVKSISGPLDTEGNVATQIKLGEQYIFSATPNQSVAEFYLLAIKWAYRLDDGELTFFKNQTEIANSTQGQIAVTFPKSFKASKIKVYGFYVSASERVCVELGTDYVLEESVVEESVVKPEILNPAKADEGEKIFDIIFPLLVKPENDKDGTWGKNYYWADNEGANQATFNSNRSNRTRKHAARDLYTLPETVVVAICKGKVLEVKPFYAQTDQVTILHETNNGRKFIIRYGELAPDSIIVKEGDDVTQKQPLGVTGKLVGITVIPQENVYMIHFEHFTGKEGLDLKNTLTSSLQPFMRRNDLIDSIKILQEGYNNTFGEVKVKSDKLFTVSDGKKAIADLYTKYEDKKWNWSWNGSTELIEVTGRDLITIVEKMYRLETAHFTSKQYQNCGTKGMEVFGKAPFYGWDSTLFIEEPIGTWSAFEGKGLSGQGGNSQDIKKKKEFIKLPSVITGMEYKINYIIKYNGNYARWYNTKTEAQEKYRTSLVGIKAKFIEAL